MSLHEFIFIYVVADFDFQPILFTLLKLKGVQNFLFGGYLGELKTPKTRKNREKKFHFLRVPPLVSLEENQNRLAESDSAEKSKSATTYILVCRVCRVGRYNTSI